MIDPKASDKSHTSEPIARAARVIIVDDSALVRQVLQTQLSRQRGIEVVATAADPIAAREKILALKPDCIILDIEMPHMNGLVFLRKLMKFHPVPTIICSSVTPQGCTLALECLEAGALEVVSKPGGSFSVGEVANRLAELVRVAVHAPPRACVAARMPRTVESAGVPSEKPYAPAPARAGSKSTGIPPISHRSGMSDRLIAIGTSTGGTEALRAVLATLPAETPPILIVQHMPEGFTKAFADRLNGMCKITVKEAEDGDEVVPGRALLAAGSFHMRLVRENTPSGAKWRVRVADGPKVLRHKPSVEVLFESCAQYAGSRAMGMIWTGMGGDGATGLLSMRKAGAVTVGQDEQTCVVYGMPREAALCGAVQVVAPLDRMAELMMEFASGGLTACAA